MNGSKKISISASWRKKNGRLIKFLTGAAVFLFLIAVFNFFSSEIKNAFYSFTAPIQKTFWTAGESSAGFLASFLNAGLLHKENENLKNEIQKLNVEIASLQAIVNGNAAQSAVSLASQNKEFNLLMAGVIGLDDQDILSVNKGSADGISEGMPVINQHGALFGKIFKVYKNFSRIMLISNKNSVISVKVRQNDAAKSEINGVIRGIGKSAVYLELVPIDVIINQGDLLLTSALEGTFPKDLLVGTITKIEKNDQNPHQQAQVKPFSSASVNNLFVITNYKQQ